MINTLSARVAIAVATANGMRIPEWCAEVIDGGGGRGNIASVLHALDCGRVLAAVDRTSEAARHWLLLAYGADGYAPSRAAHLVACHLQLTYVQERHVRSEPNRLAGAAGAVVGDLVKQYRSPTRPGAGPGEYCKAIGVPADRWKDWKPAVERMQRIVDGWDRQGLGLVAAELPAEIREVA